MARGSYDVIDVASQWDGEFAPYLTDLSDFMDKDNYKTDEFIEKVLENSGEWQGVQTGIPNASTPQLFAYRTDLLPNRTSRYIGKSTEKLQRTDR